MHADWQKVHASEVELFGRRRPVSIAYRDRLHAAIGLMACSPLLASSVNIEVG